MPTAYHEPFEKLSPESREIHRALSSLIEELEAVDWYHQRADVTEDEELKAVLIHNRNEEIEHAAMMLEWVARHIPEFRDELGTYLFTSKPITEVEENAEGGSEKTPEETGSESDLKIGRMRQDR